MRITTYISASVLPFLVASTAAPAQPAISPAAVAQLQKQLTPEQVSAASRQLQQLVNDADTEAPPDGRPEEDELEAETSVTSVPSGVAHAPSAYKTMFRGEILHPDKLLGDLDVFGLSVFRNAGPTDLAKAPFSPVPVDYPVASGDEIVLLLWGRINEEVRLTVGRDGTVRVPRIGPVPVAGLPFKTMRSNLLDRIQNIEGVQASVSMGTLRDVRVFVVGELVRPGQYTLGALTTVTTALFAAGGLSQRASLRRIKLVRGHKTIRVFDFYDFLLSGNSFSDIRLKNDDVIQVPIANSMAGIVGNVRRSALYELKGKTSLKDMVALAGGLIPAAWINRIQIERFDNNDTRIVLDIQAPADALLPDFDIIDGDLIKIFPVVEFDKNAVYLSGNVLRPGKYELHAQMRVSDLVQDHTNLLQETYLDYAVLRRSSPPTYAECLISINLGAVLDDPASPDNYLLEPGDHVIIYHHDFFEPDRSVYISGAVTTPGQYRLLENMHIKDLILEAGGLRDNASETRGELYKRILRADSVHTSKIAFGVKLAMQGSPEHDLPLGKSDRVFIRQKQGWESTRTIVLQGEFVYSGTYVLMEGETLAEVIERAAGFTPDAYLDAAIFSRPSVKMFEARKNREYISRLRFDIAGVTTEMAQGNSTEEVVALLQQQQTLLQTLLEFEPVGRVVMDLHSLSSYRDFEIEDGDILYVPKRQNTVSVIGEVYNPATFVLDRDNPATHHYIDIAGGYNERANKDGVYVIKANGSVTTRRGRKLLGSVLYPGDAVVVPFDIPKGIGKFKVFMQTLLAITDLTSKALLVTTSILAIRSAQN